MVKRFHELAPQKHAITVFEAVIDGRRTYFQGTAAIPLPARDKLTSFVALRVDAESIRREFLPAFMTARLKTVEGPDGSPAPGRHRARPGQPDPLPVGGAAPTEFIDERVFPLVFFDPELQPLIAPEGHKPEIWRLRTSYATRPFPTSSPRASGRSER